MMTIGVRIERLPDRELLHAREYMLRVDLGDSHLTFTTGRGTLRIDLAGFQPDARPQYWHVGDMLLTVGMWPSVPANA